MSSKPLSFALFISLSFFAVNKSSASGFPPRADHHAHLFSQGQASQLDGYVREFMERTRVPGAAVGVVQNGKVVYAKGFGVRQLGRTDPVTPDTLMMIGSTGKSMTSFMMATLVDERKFSWDTPVVKIYPRFALSDSALTPKLTLRDLICNCSGVQRHDLEMFFATKKPTPAEVIDSIRTFGFVGEFRKTFGYINQMVAAGGYLAARSANRGADLQKSYAREMQSRVFDPIGMPNSTFSFDRVQATADHATPHGQSADNTYVAVPLEIEKLLEPYAPAGGSWSNVTDMARYLITQINEGVAPNGQRVVSAASLKETWKPIVQIAPGAHYGLGWVVTDYNGQKMLSHGGGTAGFSSDLTFLPEAGLGIVVLANAQNAQLFGTGVRSRVLELAFGQPSQRHAVFMQRLAESQKQFEATTKAIQPLDRDAIAPYLGAYSREDLGRIILLVKDEKLVLSAGQFDSELRSVGGGKFVVWDPPLVGLSVLLARSEKGEPTVSVVSEEPDQSGTWRFTRE